MCQVVTHALLDHITTGHVTPDSSLEYHGVRPDLREDLPKPAHAAVRLDLARNLIDVSDTAANNQSFQTLLNLLGRDVQSEVLLLSQRVLDNIEASFLVPIEVAADSSLHVPRSPIIDSLARHGESIVYDALLEGQTEQEFTHSVDVCTVVRVLNNGLPGIQTVHELITEKMLFQHVLYPLTRFLFKNESLVGLERNDGLLKCCFEVLTLDALFPCIKEPVTVLYEPDTSHLPLELKDRLVWPKCFLDGPCPFCELLAGLGQAEVENLLDLWHHEYLCVTDSVLFVT